MFLNQSRPSGSAEHRQSSSSNSIKPLNIEIDMKQHLPSVLVASDVYAVLYNLKKLLSSEFVVHTALNGFEAF